MYLLLIHPQISDRTEISYNTLTHTRYFPLYVPPWENLREPSLSSCYSLNWLLFRATLKHSYCLATSFYNYPGNFFCFIHSSVESSVSKFLFLSFFLSVPLHTPCKPSFPHTPFFGDNVFVISYHLNNSFG